MSKELVNVGVVMPLVTPEEAKAQWKSYQALKASVLSESDFQKIGDGKFTKKSGFRKIATFFGLTDKIIEKERVEVKDGFLWRFTVEAIAPNGRSSQGVGICDSRERKFSHVEHDVFATAHTRAKNRAISDLVAGGEVSAEEMRGEAFNPPATRKEVVAEVVEEQQFTAWDGDLSIPNIQAYLSENGFEGEKFKLHHDEPTRMYVIDSAPWTDDFDKLKAVVKEMGGEYDRDHKKTVFRY